MIELIGRKLILKMIGYKEVSVTEMKSQDFDIINRSTQQIEVTVLDQDDQFVNLGLLSGASFTVKANKDDPDIDAKMQLGLGTGISVVNSLTGKIQIDMDTSDTDIDADRYYYDLVLIFTADEYTVLYGTVNIQERITD